MGYIVSKFGGWANASSDNVRMAADLFEKNSDRKIKVNSAIGKVEGLPKVTDLLVEGVEIALQTGKFPDELFNKIKLNHYAVFKPLGLSEAVIDDVVNILTKHLATRLDHSPDHFRALIIGSGEELFSRLDAYYMSEIRKLPAKFVDPKEIGHFLSGHPINGRITAEGYENLAKLKEIDYIAVYPGFYAADINGKPMIYSRGGTDKTASDIAKAINASLYENWKDVDGIYCADPKMIKNPELMKEVTYKEIRELSYISFNVLHQEAMMPAMQVNIPINIKNLHKPDSEGTLIVNKRAVSPNRPVIGIARLRDICSINLEKCLMNEEIGFADHVLSLFRENYISIEQITTGIDSIGLLVRESEFDEKSVLIGVSESVRTAIDKDEFTTYLKKELQADKVQIRKKRTILCVVGEGMRNHVGTLSKLSKVMSDAQINIEIIDQGPSERNIILAIKDTADGAISQKAVQIIYGEFFKSIGTLK